MIGAAPIRLALAGVDTFVGSTLCARCPLGPLGCCATPPAFTWADVGRIVAHGGDDWLLDEIAAGRLRPNSRGLSVLRRAPSASEPPRCAYHGPRGCTIAPEQRSATCNDYLCSDALQEAALVDPEMAAVAGAVHQRLAALYARWDEAIAATVQTRWPDGPPWDAVFVADIGREHARLVAEHAEELEVACRGATVPPPAAWPSMV